MASGRMALGDAKSGRDVDPTLRPDWRLAFRRPGRQTHRAHRTQGIIFADDLEQVHGITKDNPRETGRKSTLSRRTSLANVQSQLSSTSWTRTSSVTNRIEFNSDVFKAPWIRWICSSNISFAIVEHHRFRQLLTYLFPSVCFIY